MVKSTGSEKKKKKYRFWSQTAQASLPALAFITWGHGVISPSLSFLTHKVRLPRVPPSEDC